MPSCAVPSLVDKQSSTSEHDIAKDALCYHMLHCHHYPTVPCVQHQSRRVQHVMRCRTAEVWPLRSSLLNIHRALSASCSATLHCVLIHNAARQYSTCVWCKQSMLKQMMKHCSIALSLSHSLASYSSIQPWLHHEHSLTTTTRSIAAMQSSTTRNAVHLTTRC